MGVVADEIDRSTGDAAARRGGLGTHARRFILISVTLLVAACSSLKLGYNNADTLLLYALDNYLDLDERQQALAGERVRRLLGWHRATQLAGYAQLLAEAQRTLGGSVGADEVATLQQRMNAKLAAIGEQVAPDLAALAQTLSPAQIDQFAAKLAKESSRARRELVRFAGGRESVDARVKRYRERAESWFGAVNEAQTQILRDALESRTEAWWLDERERRQNEMVQLLRQIQDEQPPAAEAARRVRDFFAQLVEPSDEARRVALMEYRRANAELIARLINAATPAQRATLAKKLRGYADDFTALAAANGRG
jgi:hypothetical protein